MTHRSATGLIGAVLILVTACGSSATPSPAYPTSIPSTSTPLPTAPSTAPSAVPSPSVSASVSQSPAASPSIDPANFSTTIDNPWFPLTPGTVLTYRGTKDGKKAVDVYTVTSGTRVIDGVTCLAIEDRLDLDGRLEEKTTDYYVQDRAGNVWYFGEDTQTLDKNGKVTGTEGTWHAGQDGATPGIFMEADPTPGHVFEQEYYKGHAEDHFRVLRLDAAVKVPYASYGGGVLLTEEWTPLEPDVLDNKYYVLGLGEVREVAVKGPVEELVLVSIKRP